MYYKDCKLINKEIFDLIKDMIKIYLDKIKPVKCIFDNGEIIILLKDGNNEVIYVGNLEKGNDLKVKKVIEKGTKIPSEIASKVKALGVNDWSQHSFSNQNSNGANTKINKGKDNAQVIEEERYF